MRWLEAKSTAMVESISKSERSLLPEGEVLRLNDWAEAGGWLLAGFALLLGAFLLVVPAVRSHHVDGALRPVVGLIWIAFGLLIAGGTRSGLIVDSYGITVQSLVRRTSWKWSEVAGFDLKQSFYRPALRIRLASGREVSTLGFSGKSADERRLAQERVAELNRRTLSKQREVD